MAYDLSFAREVYKNSEMGHWIKMCMQCGVCAGSCPLGPHWEHSPRQLFQMVRAGKKEEVLKSSSMWMCTSCYNCIVRCPRHLPITHIVHGLARYAMEQGMANPQQPTHRFASKVFWENIVATGRVGEAGLTMKLYFLDGLGAGIRMGLEMKDVALGMVKTGRLNPIPFRGKIKGYAGFQAMLQKAAAIESKHKEAKA
ncbi:MAG: 4Fe-4S dicluster domain-containing protein [Magnetococcales bacterium]|nr:4Fe-4S dicluster domain-containing protein [Magnetococcales bacterium]MBF0155855.1 4Fe-4S dicluster domain-containing protein [Magnetococcales bacterium]